jgi:7-carboxy-7-deazaguanine synthase
MKVQEIFETVQGEGIYSGAITTFIRFAGCSLKCEHCDTKYAWTVEDHLTDVGVPFIIDAVLSISRTPRHICITGGEPLEQPQQELFNLLQTLQGWHGTRGLESIVIETNGSQDVSWLLDKPFRTITKLSVDYKLPGSGKHSKMIHDNFKRLTKGDVIKFICDGEDDFKYAVNFAMTELEQPAQQAPILLFHAMGGKPSDWLSAAVLEATDMIERFDVRAGVQLHKLLNVR